MRKVIVRRFVLQRAERIWMMGQSGRGSWETVSTMSCISAHLGNGRGAGGTGGLCPGFSFQRCLFSQQSQRIEVEPPSGAKGRAADCPAKKDDVPFGAGARVSVRTDPGSLNSGFLTCDTRPPRGQHLPGLLGATDVRFGEQWKPMQM